MRRILLCAAATLSLLGGPALAQTPVPKIYGSASTITPGTPVPFGDGVALACSVAGTLRLVMSDGTFFDVYALQGTAMIDRLAVQGVSTTAPAGTAATCTVTVLRSK